MHDRILAHILIHTIQAASFLVSPIHTLIEKTVTDDRVLRIGLGVVLVESPGPLERSEKSTSVVTAQPTDALPMLP